MTKRRAGLRPRRLPPRLIRDASFLEIDRREIARRRGRHNRLGFACQVAFVRVLGRFPRQAPLEIDGGILRFVALQLGTDAETIHAYAGSRRSPNISSASASTCACALSMPPVNGWRGSSKLRRPENTVGRAPAHAQP